MPVKFGISQADNPTPSKINFWVRVYTVIAGIFLGWMATNNLIGPQTQNMLGSIIGLTLAMANGLAPLFGIDLGNSNQKRVSINDVSAMEEPKKTD